MSFMYKSMGAKHSNWQLSQNNQYVSYALLSWGGRIDDKRIVTHCRLKVTLCGCNEYKQLNVKDYRDIINVR